MSDADGAQRYDVTVAGAAVAGAPAYMDSVPEAAVGRRA